MGLTTEWVKLGNITFADWLDKESYHEWVGLSKERREWGGETMVPGVRC
jgi:hypothetical protein